MRETQILKTAWEKTMKRRLLFTLVGVAIGFALSTFAQQTTIPDPKLRDASAALNKSFDDGFINGDAAALAALYTEDAVIVSPDAEPIYGRDAIEQHWADLFKKVHFSKHLRTLEQYSPHIIGTGGNEAWMTGEWSAIFQVENGIPLRINGRYLNILVREGDALKFKVETYSSTGPPTPAETK
jgi:ketosteroid isomerase-like protein